ncbi:MAG TPA: prolyl oligopeptidase family serine peptidase [Thermoanaerobaculia bacterium]|jgi:dipeptidyl aminopeptidase/acylaminoacyl peptidase|nr:prolyl oligopeptidase family serine peptidase [Thermoanaerobaculia bacterium]
MPTRVLFVPALACAGLLAAAAARPAFPAFSIEQVLGAPFPSQLTAARQGERVAWVMDRHGERNVWVADGPDWVPRQVTGYLGDDGQPLASLRLTPDGQTVLYARGTEVNEAGESANPASRAQAPKQQVWAVAVPAAPAPGEAAGDAASARRAPPRLLGDMGCAEEGCEDIQVSPDGRFAVWTAKHHLWLAPVAAAETPAAGAAATAGAESAAAGGAEARTAPAAAEPSGALALAASGAAAVAAAGAAGPARQLLALQGDASQQRWSPDGKRLAFRLLRGDHSYIAVFELATERVVYLAPSVDRDEVPRWSRDGSRIAFIREPSVAEKLPLIPERPHPWSLWLGDPATGEAREIWRGAAGPEGSLSPFAADSLLFAAGDRIVFAAEQNEGGRNHLYSIPAAGGQPAELTPGDYDVEDVELSADGGSVLYSANEHRADPADEDRRHLWRVSVAGGAPRALTAGEGIEWSPVETGDGKVVLCLGSTATTPAAPYRLAAGTGSGPGAGAVMGSGSASGAAPGPVSGSASGAAAPAGSRVPLAPDLLPADFPAGELVVPRQVIFKSSDGLLVHGQLFLPRSAPSPGSAGGGGSLPALVFTHGGPVRQMLLGFHYMQYYHNAYAMNQYLASRGYAVLSVNYRLGIMYGRAFREAPNSAWRGSAEYGDVVAGAHFLQQLPQVDPHRIGLWGGSYGGLLTALGLARNSDLFLAGVDFHGVHDWSLFLPRWDGAAASPAAPPDLREAYQLAFASSPDAAVDSWRSPVLLIHGDDDRNVPFGQTRDLTQRLRGRGVTVEELIFPDEIHDLLLWRDWVRSYRAAADFFDRRLRGGH